jgi:ABC-type nitrate/sulfonate/bicarbonate transport system ATPase subunit
MLSFDNISHEYPKGTEKLPALKSIDLQVARGEFLTILGPSGSGKSTLIHIAGGFIKPSGGEVRLQDAPVGKPGRDKAMVFQDANLFPWMSVEGNLRIALENEVLSDRRKKDKIAEVLDLVGLKGFDSSLPHQLSGGMKQKVSIARALLMEAPLLLMDEPFSNLDERTRDRLNRDLLEIWKQRGQTILFVTHSIEEALRLGTRTLLLSKRPGKIVKGWDTRAIGEDIADPRFINIYKEIHTTMELCCPPSYENKMR